MSEEKKKRNKIIGISIGILVVLLVVISSTYAYWQITKSQDGSNDIIAACLSIDMQSVDGTFEMNPAWPISDEEGMNLTGYTFKVTNNCEEDVNYIIGMDSLEVSNVEYLSYDSIKLSVDNNDPLIYGSQENIEHIEENDPYQIRHSKKLYTAVVKGKVGDTPGSNTHNVKVWIKAESDLEDREKVFSGRMFITGGQKIENDKPLVITTPEKCFEMDKETGTEIIGYDESCGDSVIIPATVKGNSVKTIDSDAFKENVTIYNYDFVAVTDSNGTPQRAYILDSSENEVIREWGDSHGFDSVEMNPYVGTPEVSDGEMILYCNMGDDINNLCELPGERELMYTESLVSIKELDLSQAYNLELIEAIAFSNHKLEYDDEIGMIDSFWKQYDSQITSLTSLKFGENKELKLGLGAFNGIDVQNLEVYSNIIAEENIIDYFTDGTTPKYDYYLLGYFAGSKIDNLTIKYVEGYEILTDLIYVLINSNNIIIEDGITTIGDGEFDGQEKGTLYGKFVTLPSSINNIGDRVFTNWPSNSIINVLKTEEDFLTNVTTGTKWYGNATVKFLDE